MEYENLEIVDGNLKKNSLVINIIDLAGNSATQQVNFYYDSKRPQINGTIELKDGDNIEIDVPNEKLTIVISDDELQQRLDAWEPPPQKVKKGYLAVYSKMAKSADKGAALDYGDA